VITIKKETSMTYLANLVIVGGAMLIAAGAAQAQSLTIDDFTTGPVSIQFVGAKQTGDMSKVTRQKGSGILGGLRVTQYAMPLAANVFQQNAGLTIKPATQAAPAGLFVGSGFQADTRVDMSYGYSTKHLNVDLTPYDRLRLTFSGQNGQTDFEFEVWSTIAGVFTGASWNCDLQQPNGQSNWPNTEFTVDLKLADISGPVNLPAVQAFYLVAESAGQGGQDFGIEKIEAVSGGQADITCTGNGAIRAKRNPH
jgi:hypothetical protein